MAPKLYLIIPFYNAETYLSDLVQSLTSQTHSHFHAFFIDDQSTDAGRRFLESTPTPFKKTLLHTPTRMGPLGARVTAMKAAAAQPADVFCFIDGDDYLNSPQALEKVQQCYENPDCLMTHGSFRSVFQGKERFSRDLHFYHLSEPEFLNFRQRGANALSHLRTIRASVFQKMLAIDSELGFLKRKDTGTYFTFATDLIFSVCTSELIEYTNLFHIPEPIYYYRAHAQTTTATHTPAERTHIMQLIRQAPSLRT